MIIYPAIDLYEGKAVRLKRGDYEQMTIYSDNPAAIATGFKEAGATSAHIIDLEGARDGKPANFDVIKRIAAESGLDIQVGGGVRSAEIIKRYLDIGVRRVILGTAAVSTPGFLPEAVETFGDSIAVSADIKDGFVAIKGWTETSDLDVLGFCRTVEEVGVKTLICTDISKDGLLSGTNIALYRTLREELSIAIIASGGITTLDARTTLSARGINGAILGKALYTGNIDLASASNAVKKEGNSK
jgi:phosphoribosylformimino-5-aminoimidazole carboxamide ribotide isomerase